ncbi:peptidase domain-containing ABC transporter [Synechococcus elongatus]|uniref:Peptidase domain-containing ABC transporter n=1 Tax=Synechococcus elongatus PCC 11802 TaxID=2283154 RepID=A0AAT9JSN0_SYNEL|nr:peptidase domain-containing ABC transporter [Synechococcus elongatus]QFZ92172.1 peptidase domain-containing ABC transporter [Synechococcus elongatus PCC 11802]
MKFKCIRQQSEEDCGAACIATVAKYYGRSFSLNRVREMVGTGSRGTSLLGLRRGAEALGFNARQVRASLELIDHLKEAPLPAIIHWKGYHWVTLYGQKGKRYIIADPGVGIRYIDRQELVTSWSNGVMLLLQPDNEKFYSQANDRNDSWSRIIRRVWGFKALLLQVILINIVIGILALAMPLMMQFLTDDVLIRKDTHLLFTVAIAVIAMNFFRNIISLVQSHLVGYFGQKLQLDLILEYGHRLLHLPMSYFDNHRSGEVVSRIGDIRRINDLVSQVVLGLPSQFFIALISLAVMLRYSSVLTAAAIIAFFIVTIANLVFLPFLRQKNKQLISESSENQGFLVETFRGAVLLKTTQAIHQAWEEYQQNFGRLSYLSWGALKLDLYAGTATDFLSTITNVGILWLGSRLVIDGTMSIGQLLAFNGFSGNLLGFLGGTVALADEFLISQVVIQRLSEVLGTTPENTISAQKPWITISGNTNIFCKKITFHHPGRVDLLKDFDLTIPGGLVTALIGQSGCGKSTLAKLISGLYQLDSGNIQFDIYNQQDIALDCLRQQVVLVPQDAHFWSRSIIENFKFSHPNVSFENIVKACRMTMADEFIDELPDKYQTVLGEFGANLSGGQRQRLALARAIVNNPPVLILDESTSALDPVMESQILDRLLTFRKGKTTIIISHRPRVIQRSDWVAFLEKGELKAQGRPNDLQALMGDHLKFIAP